MIVRAERIAMGQKHPLAVELGNDGIREKPAAGAVAELAAQQEIPVPVEQEARDAPGSQRAQSFADEGFVGVGVVIADPRLEEIAQDVERLGACGVRVQEPEEPLDGSRLARIQMHIGDEQAGQVAPLSRVGRFREPALLRRQDGLG
jgi:hypothetical protein